MPAHTAIKEADSLPRAFARTASRPCSMSFDREALIDRARRSVVESVDVAGLPRRWAESFDVLDSNSAWVHLAKQARAAAERLADAWPRGRIAIAGSFAAVHLALVVAPARLMAYAEHSELVAGQLGLLPADTAANVVLRRPFDRVVWDRAMAESGLSYDAPARAAVDCLSGVGPGCRPRAKRSLIGSGRAKHRWMNYTERACTRASRRWLSGSPTPATSRVVACSSPHFRRSPALDRVHRCRRRRYLRTGSADPAVVPYTTDADLALDPEPSATTRGAEPP